MVILIEYVTMTLDGIGSAQKDEPRTNEVRMALVVTSERLFVRAWVTYHTRQDTRPVQ